MTNDTPQPQIDEVKDTQTSQKTVSEISKQKKKRFYLYLLIYILGFVVLATIGEKMNDDPYIFRAFLAPVLVLTGIGLIVFNFYRSDL